MWSGLPPKADLHHRPALASNAASTARPWRDARELLLEPGFERQHQGLAPFLPHSAALVIAVAADRLLDRVEDRNALESLAGDRCGAALGDVEEAATTTLRSSLSAVRT
jgi:hypothetical protein